MKNKYSKLSKTALVLMSSLVLQAPLALAQEAYTVQQGDTLYDLAQTIGASVDELMAWNGLTSDYLDVGDILYLAPAAPSAESTPETTSPAYSNGPGYHTVSAGENLWSIAYYYGTTMQVIVDANGLSSDYLDVGDQLYIPAVNDAYGPGEAVSYYGQEQSTNSTPADYSSSVTPDSTVKDGAQIHTVVAGDNLYDIAIAYGINLNDLYTWNGLSSDYLNVGDQLIVGLAGPVEDNQEVTVTDDQGQSKKIDLSKIPEKFRPKTYTVVAGDNVWKIAQKNKVSAESIRLWNDLAEDQGLTVGDQVYVSNPALVPEIHEVVEGEDLASIGADYQVAEDDLLAWNDISKAEDIKVGDQIAVSNPKPEKHQVQAGETLEDIANTYGVTVDDLRTWNNLPANALIVNGELIVADPQAGNSAE